MTAALENAVRLVFGYSIVSRGARFVKRLLLRFLMQTEN